MPSLSTLVDNFNDGVIGPNWGNSYGGVTETGGRARVPCATGYAGYQTAYSWTLAGATFYVKVVTTPAKSTATTAYCGVYVNAPDYDTSGTRIGFTVNAVTGMLRMQSDTAGTDPSAVEITYSATTHAFLRLREDGSNVYWDTSPDGTTWTNRRTLATPAWVASSVEQCALDMSAHRDAGTADYAEYDLANTLANGAVITGTASLAADSRLTAAGKVTAEAGAVLGADSALTAGAVLVQHGAATLTAGSDLTADASAEGIPEVAALSAGTHDLLIEQGATFMQTYTVLDDGWTWEGWSARAQIRSMPADQGALLLDLQPHLVVDGPSVRLSIPATVTETLTRNGVWDLEMAKGTTVVRILQGKVVVSLEVTR
ncbi:hypothetical protein ACF061_00720 [Streptomyces sp. NPDC015220]|uniref:hypothetical protein n=1 Tax=Streptomyces sp. NPDC015220 TaxID=3364947 RepID=UPI0037019694